MYVCVIWGRQGHSLEEAGIAINGNESCQAIEG